MKITDLKDKLKVNKNCFYDVILINGPWGIGKTHYVKKFLEKEKYIYLSAFGVEELDDLKYGLYYELDKKGAKFLKRSSVLYGNSIGLGPISIPIPNIKVDLEKSIKDNLKDRELIIVIDDFERKNNHIEIKELLGFAESLSQVEGIKIIIIANDEKLEGKDKEIFLDFKEKVVKRIYNIDTISEDSINDIIKEKYNKTIFGNYLKLNEYKKLTIDFFNKHNVNNLRTLQKAILFSNEVVSNIENQMDKEEIIELTKVCFAVVIEENDKIYLTIEQNKKIEKEKSTSEIYKQEDYCISKNYFNEGIILGSKIDLIRSLINIYNTINEEKSYKMIYNYFELKNSPITKNKELFYCSTEQIEKRIEEFKEKNIKNKSNKNFIEWFKELNQLYPWINKLNLTCKINDDEIINAMNMYIEEIDCTIPLHELVNFRFFVEIEDENIKNFYNILNSKVSKHYLNKKIEYLKKQVSKKIYKTNQIGELFENINNSQLVSKDIRKDIINKISKINFFIPNLNGEIDDDTWGFAHKLWNEMRLGSQEEKKEFSKCVKQEMEKANDLGKYRLDSLNNQYGIYDMVGGK